MIHDAYDFLLVYGRLLGQASVHEYQRAVRMTHTMDCTNFSFAIDPLVEVKLLKRRERANSIIIHYMYVLLEGETIQVSPENLFERVLSSKKTKTNQTYSTGNWLRWNIITMIDGLHLSWTAILPHRLYPSKLEENSFSGCFVFQFKSSRHLIEWRVTHQLRLINSFLLHRDSLTTSVEKHSFRRH